MVLMSYPYYILAKGNLVRKLPSYGRMSRGGLVITSARGSRRSSCMEERRVTVRSSAVCLHRGDVGRLFLLWQLESDCFKYEKPPLTYALKQSNTFASTAKSMKQLGSRMTLSNSIRERAGRSFVLSFLLSFCLSFFLSCSFFLPSCLHCLTY